MSVNPVLLIPLLAMAGACEEPASRSSDWDVIHAAIIVPSCATSSCHSSLAKTAGVVLEDVDETYDYLVEESGFVTPGEPRSSIMFLLEGEERPLMPPDGPLPKADVELIREWIEEGALR